MAEQLPDYLRDMQKERMNNRDPRDIRRDEMEAEQKVTTGVVKEWSEKGDAVSFHAPLGVISVDKAKEIIEKLTATVATIEKKG
jgi:hypothetical protein